MSKKIIDNESSDQAAAANELKTRRKALKSLLAASGVVAGSQALSSEWARPVVETVVLPAHAQTSSTGKTYTSGLVGAGLIQNQPWYAKTNLLDSLVTPAQAGGSGTQYFRGVRDSACGQDEAIGTTNGLYQVMFQIDGNNVDVCVSSEGNTTNDYQRCTQQGTATLIGSAISEVEVLMDGSIDLPFQQELVLLSGLTLNASQTAITGTMSVQAGPSNSSAPPTCSGTFTCDLTATPYSCNTTCKDPGSAAT